MPDLSKSERARITAILSAEYEYWARHDVEEDPIGSLACIIASGAISNVLAAVLMETEPEAFREIVKARGPHSRCYQTE